MEQIKDRVLIVESDPIISDFIGRQSLASAGYQLFTVPDASSALEKIMQAAPDLIISNINLPDLSAKDLIVAISAQGLEIPVIVLAKEGKESEIIQTFRMGAADYLIWPTRETEILRSVERNLKRIHERRDRSLLENKLKETNQQLQQRVRELTAIFSMGKAVTSITDQRVLFNKIIQVACQVSYADLGWFLMREEEKARTFLLVAQNKLPDSLAEKMHQAWDDGISSLVAMSGETLAVHGDPIKRFRIKILGESIMVVPVKVHRQVVGILVVMRREAKPFLEGEQHLLEAMADYASISLVNARLFRAIESRALTLETLANRTHQSEKINYELLDLTQKQIKQVVNHTQDILIQLSKDPNIHWTPNQKKMLFGIQNNLRKSADIALTIMPVSSRNVLNPLQSSDLSEQTRELGSHFLPMVQKNRLQLAVEVPEQPIFIDVDYTHLNEIIKGLITNAIQYCQDSGVIHLQVSQSDNSSALLTVSNNGNIPQTLRDQINNSQAIEHAEKKYRFGGIGIRLELIREIVKLYDGKIWVDHTPDSGTTFHVSLPISKKSV